MGSLLAVLVIGGIALVVIKRYLPRLRLGGLVGQGRSVRLMETISIGPRQHVHLLKVGERHLLVSSTREEVRLLADVTEAVPDGEAPAAAEPTPEAPATDAKPAKGSFINILTKLGGGK